MRDTVCSVEFGPIKAVSQHCHVHQFAYFAIAYVHCVVPENIHTLPTKARKRTELLRGIGGPNGGNFQGGGGVLFDFFFFTGASKLSLF